MLHVALLLISWLFSGVAHAEEDPGVLKIDANVPGAEIRIDYEPVGETPLTRYMPPGTYSVRVAADGFNPFVQRVTVYPGKRVDLNATLMRGGGTVEFVVEPGGANIELNGQDTGFRTPTRIPSVPAGTYVYVVSKPGYEPTKGSFQLNEGGNAVVVGSLESSAGRFSISSRPEGATVYLDGEMVGVTPVDLVGIHPGTHQVGLVHPDYAMVVREVDTSDGSKGVVDSKLKDEGAKVVVSTGSGSGTVSLDGVPLGTGSKVKVQAARGSYELVVGGTGAEPVALDIVVPLSGSVHYAAELAPSGGISTLVEKKPPLKRPLTWIAVGGGAALVGGGAIVTARILAPEPDPEGDVVLQLP